MAIAVGEKLPEATFGVMRDGKSGKMTTGEIFKGKRVALFAVPGAYTPTCHMKHMPGFIANADAFKRKGIEIACVSVNDAYVMGQWGKDTGAEAQGILMLADGSGAFTKAIGLDLDLDKHGLGLRSQRYAMLVNDGVVEVLNIEENSGEAETSSADNLLAAT
jgi:peroxiredoxin